MVEKIEIGRKYKIISDTCFHGFEIGSIVTIERVENDYRFFTMEKAGTYVRREDVINIDNKLNNLIMNTIEKIKLARKGQPEKTLVEAGLMNMDDSLTRDGNEVLNDILVQEYKEKMKVIAEQIIADKKEEAK